MCHVTCKVLHILCQMSCVKRHMSKIMCHNFFVCCIYIFFYFFYGQRGEASQWRVCYQRLVLTFFILNSLPLGGFYYFSDVRSSDSVNSWCPRIQSLDYVVWSIDQTLRICIQVQFSQRYGQIKDRRPNFFLNIFGLA